MAYIGRPLQVANLAVQSGTGDGSDTTPIATLDYATVTNGIAVYLDGVRQLAGTDFNVTAQTTLTFTTAPANGVGVDVYFLGLELSIPTPADATVSTAKIIDNAVTLAKMAPGTDGNIISYDASGNPVAIATGSDGQVLTSTGAGSPPAFEAAGVAGISSSANANAIVISADEQVTMPLQPAFSAQQSSDQTSLAINTYIILTLAAERFDLGGDFNTSTYTFTAPITGKYQLSAQIRFLTFDVAATFSYLRISTSNKAYYQVWEPDAFAASGSYTATLSILVDMDASDTAALYGYMQGGGASWGINASQSNFTGFLVA